MALLHYIASVPIAGDGTYSYRLYAFDKAAVSSAGKHFKTSSAITGQMWFHYAMLSYLGASPVDFSDHLLEPLPPFHLSAEGETLQSIPTYDNIKLTVFTDPMFQRLWGMIRNRDAQIWLEVTLTQPVLDCPPYPVGGGGSINWPRKKRLLFWGQLVAHDVEETVINQDITQGRSWQLERNTLDHDGTIDLPFAHWLKVYSTSQQAVYDWLNAFRPAVPASTGQAFTTYSALIQSLIQNVNPTSLFRMGDDIIGGSGLTPSIPLSPTMSFTTGSGGTFTNLDDVTVKMTDTGLYGPLFYNDPNGGNSRSFYGFKDFGEALFRLCGEFFLFPQIELPTLDEAFKVPIGTANNKNAHTKYWESIARWIFTPLDTTLDKFYAQPNVNTIKISPAANFDSSITVTNPSNEDAANYVPPGVPAPPLMYTKILSGLIGGADESFSTLLQFCGVQYVWNPVTISWNLVPDPRGWEIYIGSTLVTSVTYQGTLYDSWATFQADFRMNRWGNMRSIIKFEMNGVGINPYGLDTTTNGVPIVQPIKTWGRLDFGDFPLLRVLNAKLGLMELQPGDILKYQLYDIERQPTREGSITKVSLIELGEFAASTNVQILAAVPPPPPPNRDQSPPTVTTGTPTPLIAGQVKNTVSVTVVASDNVAVTMVKLYFNGQLIDFMTAPTSGTNWTFTWNSKSTPNATASLTATAFDASGNFASSSITVTVNN